MRKRIYGSEYTLVYTEGRVNPIYTPDPNTRKRRPSLTKVSTFTLTAVDVICSGFNSARNAVEKRHGRHAHASH
jgi:hypothetical protein